MTGTRLPAGGEIDRSRPLGFTFDGRRLSGFAGDTIASALLASGVRVVGRSFKYHRPRGVLATGPEEPNALLDLWLGERHDPLARATLEPLADGHELSSVHAAGTAERDRLAPLDRLWPFLPAGFYYKTFMRPSWHLFEPRIRAMAGLGRLDPTASARRSEHRFATVDLLVVGGGPAGLQAALTAARKGERVLLVEQDVRLGGSLLARPVEIDGLCAPAFIAAAEQGLVKAGARVLLRSTAIALYDHGSAAIVERGLPDDAEVNGERLWRVRARRIVLATGAIERPLLFADNDRPGVMLAGAALSYLRRHAVLVGRKVLIATTNDSAYALAEALAASGASVRLVDSRPQPSVSGPGRNGIESRRNARVVAALGRRGVEGALLSTGEEVAADVIAVSGGHQPTLHLWCQAKGKPHWDASTGQMLPGEPVEGIAVIGSANGTWSLEAALAEAEAAGGGPPTGMRLRSHASEGMTWTAPPLPAEGPAGSRIWVDLQSDVTTKDVALAARESYSSVEHLKRYTTLGMATDQGKTSGINGLAVLAAETGREIGDLGITTFRPPYVPVSFATVAGRERRELHTPVRRLPAEAVHRAERAHFREYGRILRPAWYGGSRAAVTEECLAARGEVVVFDGSPLGKVEVLGPGAARLMDFVFYTRMSTLAPGRLRYGLMLTEGGAILDDGVVLRLAEDRFVVSCSSSHVAAVVAQLEEWRQDRGWAADVVIHDTTPRWGTVSVAGPGSRQVVAGLGLEVPLEDEALPHMAMREGRFEGKPARIARVSFIGERSYEISVPASLTAKLWQKARAAGARPMGVEALSVLRTEKGFIIVGADTDGETMPHDIGMGGPREKRKDAYVGDRSLFLPAALDPSRKQLTGIQVIGREPIPAGAHVVEGSGRGRRSIGFVTSSYMSPTLGRPVALGLVERARGRQGDEVELHHLGRGFRARLVAPCFLDPQGARLDA